jgi:hypothetical protein
MGFYLAFKGLNKRGDFYKRGCRREEDNKHGINGIGQQDVDWIKWLSIRCFEYCKTTICFHKILQFSAHIFVLKYYVKQGLLLPTGKSDAQCAAVMLI